MSLHLIGASAGTGKTERLSHVVADALAVHAEPKLEIEGLIAVTYTRKAEAELKSRIHQTLIRRGAYDEAQRLPLAYIGTIHAICKRLLTEFALAVGISPSLDVLPEEASERALAELLEAALDHEHQKKLEDVCRRLRPNWDGENRRHNRIPDAEDLLELARSNKIAAAELPRMAERSIAGLVPILGRRHDDGAGITEALRSELEVALRKLGSGDGVQLTDTAINVLTDAARDLETRGELPWGSWARLATIQASANQRDVMAPVNLAAARHREHPQFHDDLCDYLRLLYNAVSKGLAGYAAWKEERRYIDYVDMEERALDLLGQPEVADDLRGRLQLLVVDEFQDTSPLQLALFLKLDALCPRSVWVGDRKQSIFAFRGADPALMDAVVARVLDRGSTAEVLDTNYRSRKALVDFCSDVFAKAFSLHGYEPKDVRVRSKDESDDPRLATLPPLGCWLLEAKSNAEEAKALAAAVGRMLAAPSSTPVLDRVTGRIRDVAPPDIAVLVATNDEALGVAQALGALGISAATPRKRLLETPEGTMLHAALRVVADPFDTAARAQIEALTEFDGRDPDAWLLQLLEAHASNEAAPHSELLAKLDRDRAFTLKLSPIECVDALVGALDLCARCMRWSSPEERLANLEAFRGLAAAYEAEVRTAHAAGSIVGFLHFLEQAATAQREDSDRGRRDDQHVTGTDAVQICTYHRAKGLEWPVVVLASLHSKTRAFGIPPDAAAVRLERGGRWQYFSAAPESESTAIEVDDPLKGRWLRFWPWPYGTKVAASLVEEVGRQPESQRLVDAAARESLRLLYVGFTRARDHLIFAVRAKKKEKKATKTKPVSVEITLGAEWLETIHAGQGALLQLPTSSNELQQVLVQGAPSVMARVWWIEPVLSSAQISLQLARSWYSAVEAPARPDYRIAPSRAAIDLPELASEEWQVTIHQLGERISLVGSNLSMNEIGNAVHAVFAADPIDRPTEIRSAIVERVLAGYGLSSALRADRLLKAQDTLKAWLDSRYAGSHWRREVPIAGAIETPAGRREIHGAIDLLLETDAGWILIDHKTFPGAESEWESRALDHAPQLTAYRRALSVCSDKPVLRSFIHLPIGGSILELIRREL